MSRDEWISLLLITQNNFGLFCWGEVTPKYTKRQFKQQTAKQAVMSRASVLQLTLFCLKYVGNEPLNMLGYWREKKVLIGFMFFPMLR